MDDKTVLITTPANEPEVLRKYNIEGTDYLLPNRSCAFCKHCTDIFFDWEGPYMFFCRIHKDYEQGKCPYFEEDT